jgi:hypothetical protein
MPHASMKFCTSIEDLRQIVSVKPGLEIVLDAEVQCMVGANHGMAGTRPVLVTTAIIVHMPEDRDDGFTFVEPFGDKLLHAIKEAFHETPEVEHPEAMEFQPIWIEGTNIARCEKCGTWMSDYTKPDNVAGVSGGRRINGKYLCDECETFGSEPDALPGGSST